MAESYNKWNKDWEISQGKRMKVGYSMKTYLKKWLQGKYRASQASVHPVLDLGTSSYNEGNN